MHQWWLTCELEGLPPPPPALAGSGLRERCRAAFEEASRTGATRSGLQTDVAAVRSRPDHSMAGRRPLSATTRQVDGAEPPGDRRGDATGVGGVAGAGGERGSGRETPDSDGWRGWRDQ